MIVRPEDAFTIARLVGTTEIDLGKVPERKFQRKIYSIILNEHSGTVNTLTFRLYKENVLVEEYPIRIPAYATIGFLQDMNSPILSIPAGLTLKAVAAVPSIMLILSVYDL